MVAWGRVLLTRGGGWGRLGMLVGGWDRVGARGGACTCARARACACACVRVRVCARARLCVCALVHVCVCVRVWRRQPRAHLDLARAGERRHAAQILGHPASVKQKVPLSCACCGIRADVPASIPHTEDRMRVRVQISHLVPSSYSITRRDCPAGSSANSLTVYM
eukprot:3559759-Pleurochrysis_carterae.AAC.1